MNKATKESRAEEWARSTTNTRCKKMPQCEGCTVRYCDYKSRLEAYEQGFDRAIKLMIGIAP